MLFMVIENFKHSDVKAVGDRFATSGRMLPEGLNYQASWMDTSGSRCFQIWKPTILRYSLRGFTDGTI
jgi:hypothetical protein